jgi:hypothetical protein
VPVELALEALVEVNDAAVEDEEALADFFFRTKVVVVGDSSSEASVGIFSEGS